MTPRKQVISYCKANGISCNGSGGIPLLGKGEWFQCFDDWDQALNFLVMARHAHFEDGKAYPWEEALCGNAM